MVFTWTGDAMIPLRPVQAARQYDTGKKYRLSVDEDRSDSSHNHFFAAVREAWMNLPENLAEKFPTPKHLRKFALIKTGYCKQKTFVAGTEKEAMAVAAFVEPMDEFSIVERRGTTVTVWTARSQKRNSMNKKMFQESKDAVLNELAAMVKISRETLEKNAGESA